MRLLPGGVLLGTMGFLVLAGWWIASLIWFMPWNIEHFYGRVFARFLLEEPELLSRLRVLESFGLNFHSDDLTDASDTHLLNRNALVRGELAVLRAYDRAAQSPEDLLSTDILAWFLDDQVRGQKFMYHVYPVNPLFGVQNQLPDFMANIHQVNNRQDAEHYIVRLSKFDTKFDQVLEGLRIRESKQLLPPRSVVQKVLEEMRGFVAPQTRANLLYTVFERRLSKLKVDSQTKQTLTRAAEQEVQNTVYPAYRRLITYFEHLEPLASATEGVWRLPGGYAYYAHALRHHTTTDLTPEQVHRLGLKEVSRIQKQTRTVLDRLGYRGGSISKHLKRLKREARFLYPNTLDGRSQILSEYRAIVDEAGRRSEVFTRRPRASVRVERLPEFKEKTAPVGYYSPPALDGSRPGVFYVNLRDLRTIPRWSMPTLAYHETSPGHHLQLALQQESEVPAFRKVIPFTAYIEGWAAYAEQLAWEHGFNKNPYSNLGRLRADLSTAVSLVVDTGIHYKRWTRAEAIAYMTANSDISAGGAAASVDRSAAEPGQLCAYKIGQLKILELRDRAQNELKEQFRLQEFHEVVLQNGAMPLAVLEQVVLAYIARNKP